MKRYLFLLGLIVLTISGLSQNHYEWSANSEYFDNNDSKKVIYLDFGNQPIWGNIEITLTGGWSYARTTGKLTKIFDVGYNIGNLYPQESRIKESIGSVVYHWKIGELFKDTDNHLKLPIYHLTNSQNCVTVNVKGLSQLNIDVNKFSLSQPQVSTDEVTTTREFIYINDRLGIGTKVPEYPLDVYGTIRAREIKVDMNGKTADFVFESDYKLRSLNDVESFISKNKHLPEIPSAKDMEKDGVKQGEMNQKLLQKIEELTLYIIEQNKRIEKLEKKIK